MVKFALQLGSTENCYMVIYRELLNSFITLIRICPCLAPFLMKILSGPLHGISVYINSTDEHLDHLLQAFMTLRAGKLFVDLQKYTLMQP